MNKSITVKLTTIDSDCKGMFTLFSLACFVIGLALNYSLTNYLSLKLPWYFMPTLIVLSIVLILMDIFVMDLVLITEKQKIAHTLNELLLQNTYYKLDPTDEEQKKVLVSAYFTFTIHENSVEISFYPDGLPISNNMDDLARILETKLNLPCEEIDNSSPSHTTYVMRKNNEENRINVSEKW
ncbi:hypothetical protein [Streptococcus salivarius]|uniref:hypothetical protein n=1 Tax=Streptococcus salivarius TaxID=1304 RepID=UPI0015816675|nr:hypothetical protein [Streptococcus salivarius]